MREDSGTHLDAENPVRAERPRGDGHPEDVRTPTSRATSRTSSVTGSSLVVDGGVLHPGNRFLSECRYHDLAMLYSSPPPPLV